MGIARCLRLSIKPVKKTMRSALHHSAVLGCDVSAEGQAAAPTWHWSLVEVTAVCHPAGATSFSQLEGGRAAWSDAVSKWHKQLLLSAPKWCQLCYWASSATQNRKSSAQEDNCQRQGLRVGAVFQGTAQIGLCNRRCSASPKVDFTQSSSRSDSYSTSS